MVIKKTFSGSKPKKCFPIFTSANMFQDSMTKIDALNSEPYHSIVERWMYSLLLLVIQTENSNIYWYQTTDQVVFVNIHIFKAYHWISRFPIINEILSFWHVITQLLSLLYQCDTYRQAQKPYALYRNYTTLTFGEL